MFALIGAGGGGGAILGSLLARTLSGYVEPRHFLLASALVLVVTALSTRVLSLPKTDAVAGRQVEGFDLRWPLQAVWLRPYLRRVAGIVVLSAITFTLVDFLFKSAVAARIPPDQLGSFFATTYLVLNGLSLAAQLFSVSWLMRRLNVNQVLSVLPALGSPPQSGSCLVAVWWPPSSSRASTAYCAIRCTAPRSKCSMCR